MENVFFHVDLDAFFASVEQLDNPEYKGKPVIVGGLPGDRRSVVSTCSYEARKYGVHSAMPIVKAYKLCPSGIYLRGRMKRYHEKSLEVMNILKSFSPDVQQMSIDEAFLDLTGTERLFGPPLETAKKLKEEVFNKTGLTISVGIATNKYLAKIASGMKKPDGLFFIPKGEEENFMLNLPLKDVWGIGEKTLSRLNSAGIYTTKNLHNCSKELLTTIFGECTASFMYDAVRGKAVKNFDEPVKNKSISAERTFSFDLTDMYAIETALMQISDEVFFRLLDENYNSKTIGLKIRYEDFSTVNIQETSDSYLISSDDLYQRACKLFKKKYDYKRGIRLIGINAQNVETSKFQQTELFDFNNSEKKLALEKTVLELQKKDPKNILTKARLMIKSIIIIFILLFTQNLYTEEITFKLPVLPDLIPESPVSLFQYEKDHKNIEFISDGIWEANLNGGIKFKSKNNTFGLNNIVFSQKVDLSLWFLLNKKWYFETVFADSFTESTIAAGYQGNGYLKHGRIGNSGIIFPEKYPITSIAKASGKSPGIMTQFQGKNWSSDTILRYDSLDNHEKLFLGKKEVTENNISSANWERGRRFYIPGETAEKIYSVYVQDDDGTIYDNSFRRYKKLNNSQYIIKPSQNLLLLAEQTNKAIVITFQQDIDLQNCINALGDINNEETFLGETYKAFSDAGIVNFQNYLQSSFGNDYQIEITENTNTKVRGLIIQNQPYFSPFTLGDYYRIGTNKYEEVKVIFSTTEKSLSDISSTTLKDDATFTQNDYIKKSATYAKIFNNNSETTNTDLSTKYSIAANRYPLLNFSPSIYINENAKTDILISTRCYYNTTSYSIGKNASNIQVYINGILENNYDYNVKTGVITFGRIPSDFDKIKITWQEHDNTSENGAIVLATGLENIFSEHSKLNSAASFFWSYAPEKKFSTINETSPGTFEIATKYEYQKNNFQISNKLASTIHVNDVTGIQQIISMDKNEPKTYYLPSDSFINNSEHIVPKLNSFDSSNTYPNLIKEKRKRFSNLSTQRDSHISGHAIKINWTFQEENEWDAFSIDLGSSGHALASASTFTISLKNNSIEYDYEKDFDIYLQLGVEADDDLIWENGNSIPTWKIDFNTTLYNQWQTVSIEIDEPTRTRLIENTDARIIIVQKNNSNFSEHEILFGPYEITKSNFEIINNELNITTTSHRRNFNSELYLPPSPKEDIFNYNSFNYIQKIKWDENYTLDNLSSSIVQYFEECDFSLYKFLNMEIYIPKYESLNSTPAISVYFERPLNTFSAEKIVAFTLPRELVFSLAQYNRWHTIKINLQNKTIEINEEDYTFYIDEILDFNIFTDTKECPTRLKINFELPQKSIDSLPNLNNYVYLDNFYLEEIVTNFEVSDELKVKYNKKGTIIKKNNINILSDLNIEGELLSQYYINSNIYNFKGKTNFSLNTFDISISSKNEHNYNTDSPENNFVNNSSHTINTLGNNPVFRILSFSQQYNLNKSSENAEKVDTIIINSPIRFLPGNIKLTTVATDEYGMQTQNINSELSFAIPSKNFQYKLLGKIEAEELSNQNNLNYEKDNYFTNYLDISKRQYSLGSKDAINRSTTLSLLQTFDFPKINFTPQILFEGKNIFTKDNNSSLSQNTSVTFNFPVKIKNNTLSFQWKKQSNINTNSFQSDTYINDTKNYFANLSKQNYLLTSIPFVDIFSKNLKNKITNPSSENIFNDIYGYNSTYSINWKRPLKNKPITNLLLPSSLSFITARDILHSQNGNSTDIIQLKTSLTYISMNCFGKVSKLKFFKWYQQDEFLSNYSITFKFSDNFKYLDSYLISGYNSMSFFINPLNTIQNIIDFQFIGSGNWNLKTALSWERNVQKSPVISFIKLIFPKTKTEKIFLKRKNIFTYQVYDIEGINHSFKINHELENKLGKYVTITLDSAIETIIDKDNIFSIQLLCGIIGKVKF